MANRIRFTSRRYFGFFHPLLTFEYHCFGWRKAGSDSEVVSDGYETEVNIDWDSGKGTATTREKTHIVRYQYFKRHEEYPKNPIFVLLELLMKIVSIARVMLAKFLLIGAIVVAILMGTEAEGMNIITSLVTAWFAVYGVSVAIALAGFIVRKVFRLDDKLDAVCEENGWKRWSEYPDE